MTASREEPTVESRRVFEGRLFHVRVDTVRLSGGRLTTREIVDGGHSVCIVPLDGRGGVILVRQYRKSVERFLLEIPAGAIDPGEEPEAAAGRELREETGRRAGRLEPLGFFWMTPGFCAEGMHSFLATELEPGPDSPDDDESIEVVTAPLKNIPSMIAAGEIQDAKSIASLMLCLAKGAGPV